MLFAFASIPIEFSNRFSNAGSALERYIYNQKVEEQDDRVLERDKGKALAANSTLNRLELSALKACIENQGEPNPP